MSRGLAAAVVLALLGAAGYAAWLQLEAGRMERSAWSEVADPLG